MSGATSHKRSSSSFSHSGTGQLLASRGLWSQVSSGGARAEFAALVLVTVGVLVCGCSRERDRTAAGWVCERGARAPPWRMLPSRLFLAPAASAHRGQAVGTHGLVCGCRLWSAHAVSPGNEGSSASMSVVDQCARMLWHLCWTGLCGRLPLCAALLLWVSGVGGEL